MDDGADAAYGYRTMREMAEGERPRERLLRHGPEVLSDAELIAIILGSGSAGENVLDFARRLLDGAGDLGGISRADSGTLQRLRGMGPAKAAQIIAAIELGRRSQQIDPHERPKLATPESIYRLMGARLAARGREELYVLALDTRMRLLGAPRAINGGVNAISIRPAEVFREAVILQAPQVVLVHNHPSGDPQPSPQDVATTRGLAEAGKLLEIEVVDHVVIGQGRFVSMKREGYAFTEKPAQPRAKR